MKGIKQMYNRLYASYLEKTPTQKVFYLVGVYTLLFLISMLIVFLPTVIDGRVPIYAYGDAHFQHYPAAFYYRGWLRGIVKGILQGNLNIQMWDLSVGLGSDIMTTLHYYVVGDPLSLLYVFVKPAGMPYMYSFIIVFRFYLAGLSFIVYANYMKFQKKAILIGTLTYMLSSFALYQGVYHPFFLNTLVYFPLILMGIEKVFNKERPYLLIVMICISVMSSFYFFFMIAIFSVLYAFIRYFSKNGKTKFKDFFIQFAKLAGYYLVGIGVGCVLFAPVILAFLDNGKTGTGYEHSMFLYPLFQYVDTVMQFFTVKPSTSYSTFVGLSQISFFAIAILFIGKTGKEKGSKVLRSCFLACIAFLLIPFFGYLFNGMSYVSNRWSFAFVFLVAVIVTYALPKLISLTKKEQKQIGITAGVYAAIAGLLGIIAWQNKVILVLVLFAAMAIVIILLNSKKASKLTQQKKMKWLCIAAVVVTFINIIPASVDHSKNSLLGGELFPRLTENKEIHAIGKLKDDEVFRSATTPVGMWNKSLVTKTPDTTSYFSLSSGGMSRFHKELEFITQGSGITLRGFDERPELYSLMGAKYMGYSWSAGNERMYGFEALGDNPKILENKYVLPFGYTYSATMDREAYDKLTALEKQQALVQTAVLDNVTTNVPKKEVSYPYQNVPFELVEEKGVEFKNNTFYCKVPQGSVTFEFQGVPNSTTYAAINNISIVLSNTMTHPEWHTQGMTPYERVRQQMYDAVRPERRGVMVTFKSTRTRSGELTRPGYEFYFGRDNLLANLGYSKKGASTVTLTFNTAGEYSFDDFKIIAQPMDDYAENIDALRNESLENVKLGKNELTGNINVTGDKILCIPIVYSTGWTAYVDGKKTDTFEMNTMFTGMNLAEGAHDIKLVYRTPGFTAGITISAVSIVICGVIFVYNERTRRKNKTKHPKKVK